MTHPPHPPHPLSPATWSLAGTVASQHPAAAPIELDLALPSRGIALGRGGHRDHLLGVALAAGAADADALLRPADHWLRGGDLTSIYEPADARHLRATLMWRIHDGERGTMGWEVVVSAQTSLLESDPTVAVVSDIEAGDLLWSDGPHGCQEWRPIGPDATVPVEATCVLGRRSPGDADATSIVIAVHPADRRRIIVSRDGRRTRIECWLFSTAIEKGVLLRSRVLAAVGPAAADTAWANRLVAGFAASPPPLST